ncbi:hypothetical protein F5B22DRAFT_603367 [Xylaria bambusicola]|uniref:uncharacterized protein n=1 Tax=Xylaria bambusicola TaxID=326684 RepID=UPI0020085FC5|nr:uncharacterized protein F5B22DRAFT_603367 [Xylaria bambusicola]KAI0517556.1 hypothetical protein F5B22DRAFT_603367 [Xylaria bambusicola]
MPPLDPDRPVYPYVPGFVVQITEHKPPPPFGQSFADTGYPRSARRRLSATWLDETPLTRQVIENPPLTTVWSSTIPSRIATLKITKIISKGDSSSNGKQGAHVVVCQIFMNGQQEPYIAVAKIYDALYYSGVTDVVKLADQDYSCEAAAYEHLETVKHMQKPGFAPNYYGSWTFEQPLILQGKRHLRPVRMILIEYLAGSTILDLFTMKDSRHEQPNPNAHHYDEAFRLNVVAEVIEGTVKQRHSGLSQKDGALRNIMLVPSPRGNTSPQSLPRVVLIDYNVAVVVSLLEKPLPTPSSNLPFNPVDAFRNGKDDFYGWGPVAWYDGIQGKERYQEWLLQRFGCDTSHFASIRKKTVLS